MDRRQLSERFAAHCAPPDDEGHVLWLGLRQQLTGRGIGWDYGRAPAHAISWELAHGRRVPRGKVVLQLCGVAACVAPEHLQLGTKKDLGRLLARRRETCRAGHPRTRKSTYRAPSGERRCRVCDAANARRRYHAKRAAA